VTDPSSTSLAALASRLRTAARAFGAHEDAVDRGRPWPLSDDFGTAPESHWGPPETVAHVAEMLPFWMGQIERVLDGADAGPVAFGRVADDPLRLGVIERDRQLPARELFARIRADAERVATRLAGLDGVTASGGVHPRLGAMSIATIAERFVVGHIEEHVTQLAEVLQAG
jgi:hypothetical protein